MNGESSARLVRARKRPIEILTPAEVQALLAACGRGIAGVRNRALIVVLWRTGARIAEVLELLPRDVDVAAGAVTIQHGKGDKRRVIGIDAQACAILELWIARRRAARIGPGRPLFCTISSNARGGQLDQAYVREMLARVRERAGVVKRVHAHGFRHTCASELDAEGVALSVIRQQLGHESLATTDRYIQAVTGRQVVEAMRARPGWPTAAPPTS